jgi:hypothetical protein
LRSKTATIVLEVAVALRERRALRRRVAVVEGEERRAEDAEHLEGGVGLGLRPVHPLAEPRPLEGLAAEGVVARPDEIVPVADRDAQLLGHRPAHHHPVGLVEAVGERVVARLPLEAHRRDAVEIAHARASLMAG